MAHPLRLRTGGQILVDQVRLHGARLAFCVPGESYLGALDAFWDARDTIRLITTRHEAGACHMAEAYGKLTGQPGICLVTRGPGASHAMIGVHVARQDATPVILFVGQVERGARGREAFQEIDVRALFGAMAKWATEIDEPRRIPEIVSRAFHVAVSGRPGPVVIGLPEDMLIEPAEVADARPYQAARPGPSPEALARLRELLVRAQRPIMLLGGSGWSAEAVADIAAFAAANLIPTCASLRCQDLIDNRLDVYIGELSLSILPSLAERIKGADLLIVVGDRLGELTTQGYSLVEIPTPRQALVHVFPDPDELGRVYRPEVPIASGMAEFARAARALRPVDRRAWKAWAEAARADYVQTLTPGPCPGALDMGEVIRTVQARLPENAIITSDAGNFTTWLNRFYQFTRYRSLLGPTCGAMGYGVPAAVAAKLTEPQRTVVSFVGDGGFLMTGQEIATAIQHDAPIVVLVINNDMYGTIRMHQERHYPGRYPATDLRNPNFAEYARAFGAYGEVVAETREFAGAFDRALTSGTTAVLELRLDPEAITTRTTLSAIRAAAIARQRHPEQPPQASRSANPGGR